MCGLREKIDGGRGSIGTDQAITFAQCTKSAACLRKMLEAYANGLDDKSKELKRENGVIKDKCKALEETNKDLKSHTETLQERVAELKEKAHDHAAGKEIEKLNEVIDRKNSSIQSLSGQLKNRWEELEHLKGKNRAIIGQNERLEEKQEKLEKTLTEWGKEKDKLRADLNAAEQKAKNAKVVMTVLKVTTHLPRFRFPF